MVRFYAGLGAMLICLAGLIAFASALPQNVMVHENPFDNYERLYVAPRAYPGTEINQQARVRAFDLLQEQIRARLRSSVKNVDQGRIGVPTPSGSPAGGPPGSPSSGATSWYSVGPTNINGRVTGIAIDHKRIFVSSVGGIWRSLDSGRRWERVSEGLLPVVWDSVAIEPDGTVKPEEREVLAGSGDSSYFGRAKGFGIGIWRSLKGGEPGTWSRTSPPALNKMVNIYRLLYDPAPPHNVYAATSAGVYIGVHDLGSIKWALLYGFNVPVTDIAVNFSKIGRVVYAGVPDVPSSPIFKSGIWKLVGTEWSRSDSGIVTTGIRGVALTLFPSDPAILYAKVSNLDGAKVYKTKTGGAAWSEILGPIGLDSCYKPLLSPSYCYEDYNSVIAVDPNDKKTVYVGSKSLFRTTNGGDNWEAVSDPNPSTYSNPIHPDQHSVAFDPAKTSTVFVGNDGGLFKSTDSKSTGPKIEPWHWNNISHGMVITQFYKTSSQESVATLLAGGSQDNGTEITFGNRPWYQPAGCDGATVAVDSANSDTLYGECNGVVMEFPDAVPGTAISNLGDPLQFNLPTGMMITQPFISDESVPHSGLSAGFDTIDDGSYLLRTTNEATAAPSPSSGFVVTWSQVGEALMKGVCENNLIGTFGTGNCITFITSAPSSTYLVGLLTTDPSSAGPVIAYSVSGGSSWTKTTISTLLRPNGGAIDPVNPKHAYVAFGGSVSPGGAVYVTTDGKCWADVSGVGLPAVPILAVAIDPSDSQIVYAATQVGVYRGAITIKSGDACSTVSPPTGSWVPFDEGLPLGVDVNDIWVNRAAKLLNIATFGYGAYSRDIDSTHTSGLGTTLVRDNVFDRALEPSTTGPDPEHPIEDLTRKPFTSQMTRREAV